MGGSVPEIPGIKADHHLAQQFRAEVADLLGRQALSFPGAQPVSFSAHHILELQKQDYYVCEKSDGIRCLMYFAEGDEGSEIHYLIDRKNDYYFVPGLHFPVPNDASFQNFHIKTLVDGELVMDTMPNGSQQLKYLVFDCLMIDGNSLMHRTLDKRLAYFRDKVYNPYRELYKKYPEEIQYLPFIVEFKKMEFSYGIEMMFRDILPHLPHGNDGLIFTCRNTPYKFGTDEHILKWKPASENSVDFRLNLEFPLREPDSEDEEEGPASPYPDYDAMPTFRLSANYGSGDNRPYATMYMEAPEWESMKNMGVPLDDRIVECYQDAAYRWRFLRFREDKKDANHISTVRSVIQSIEDKVSEGDLIRAAKAIRDQWKKRIAAEEAKARHEAEEKKRRTAAANARGPNNENNVHVPAKRKLEEDEDDEE
ncbi:mRNA capping enzyme, alpha subunit [Xylona heveae TC161]|uniref:mRNA-capping enzyme subunit alpha n=1 Tax=Xylona heveae (strain CBS 132557 / TC161) TaxID=1328760 RepID=A0A165FWZ7_XYLHT|nr:mRNA capping enzyme, alpha subunit [Xylona heveae TC161]KZF21485.1 mRNA capping enzyme, alpha subunit [Xylona heveae TC161]